MKVDLTLGSYDPAYVVLAISVVNKGTEGSHSSRRVATLSSKILEQAMLSAAGKCTLFKNQLLEYECHVDTGLLARAHQVTTTRAINTSCQYKQCIIL